MKTKTKLIACKNNTFFETDKKKNVNFAEGIFLLST